MSTAIQIPVWLLISTGGFIGLGILSLIAGGLAARIDRRRAARRVAAARKEERKKLQKEEEEKREKSQEEQRSAELDRLLPGPWKLLYDFLSENEYFSHNAVLLAGITFKRDVLEKRGDAIPLLCPAGLNAILTVSYYNQGSEGNCHKEMTALFQEYVKFPT